MAKKELEFEVEGKHSTNKKPKTVLGFFAIVLCIVNTGGITLIGLLAGTESLHFLIPWVLSFLALVDLGIIGGIFAVTCFDPTKLMLGQVTGNEYLANRKLTLGDNEQGEYIEEINSRIVGGKLIGLEKRDEESE